MPSILCFLPCVDDASWPMQSHDCLNIFLLKVYFYANHSILLLDNDILLFQKHWYVVEKLMGTGLLLCSLSLIWRPVCSFNSFVHEGEAEKSSLRNIWIQSQCWWMCHWIFVGQILCLNICKKKSLCSLWEMWRHLVVGLQNTGLYKRQIR